MRKAAFLLALVSIPALADDAALLRCRAIRDASARLACYDALPVAASETRAPAARPPEPQRQTPAEFGLKERANPAEMKTIESYIPGPFEGWRANSRIRLANGQVWQIADGSTHILDKNDPKVTIRRGVLGSFFLDFEGDHVSPRVRRIQ